MIKLLTNRAILVVAGCYLTTISAAIVDIYSINEDHFLKVYQVGKFVDSESCYDAVVASDENGDGRVTREEYVSLARDLSPPGLIAEDVAFNDLPLAFTNTFRSLACLCQIASLGGDPTDTECCVGSNAHIRVPDPPTSEGGSPEDVAYLYSVCSLISEAADSIMTSPFPTARPTTSPAGTPPPTSLPTSPPTPESVDTPTVSPTEIDAVPSSSPVAEPTLPPVPTVSPAPTEIPTAVIAPTPKPTTPPETITSVASVMYTIAVSSGKILIENEGFEEQYLGDLTAAMDELAVQVGDETLNRRLRALQLEMSVLLPTEIESQEEIDCPEDLTAEGDLCQDIVALVNLSMPSDLRGSPEEVSDAVSRYESNLLDAIINGDLQTELLKRRVDTPVRILTGIQPEGGETSDSESLSTGARAGIAVSIAFVVALIGIGLLVSRRKPQNNQSRKIDYSAYHGEEGSVDALPSAKPEGSVNDSLFTDDAVQITADTGAAVTLGAAEADYGKRSRKSMEAMEAGEDHLAEPGADQYDEGSSNAGSSGWSSSAGLSSLNTGSMDDSMDAAAAAGAALAALGVASGLARRGRKKDSSTLSQIPDTGGEIPPASREELDRLIEAGDWAAVGATAALLAAASDSQSLSSARSRTTDRSSAGSGSIDAARAAELDQLVDAGDWEGVVLAAAKYQTEASRNVEGTAGASVESSGDSMTGTGTDTGATRSMSTLSDSPSKIAKRAEIRAEVEALVRRVVPEEIDNVDEMMNQFKGREEELIETLRTMQERAAAQKARAASQKAAKVKAKQTVQRGVVPGVKPAAQTIASPQSMPSTPGDSDISTFVSPDSLKEQRSALELAIERGDWDAVGRAAAMIGDQSVGSPNSEDFTALNRSIDSDIPKDRDKLSGEDRARAEELDEMINVGDWSGVVSKALVFSGSPAKREATSKITDEEEEALQQAELWMQIAEQKKAEGATDSGAVDAAEWAIQRSLTQLKEADKKKPPARPSPDQEDEV